MVALTERETQQLEENYNFLYRSLKDLHAEIEEFKKHEESGRGDIYHLAMIFHHFRHAITIIMKEYINVFPGYVCCDESGKKNNRTTIEKWCEIGIINTNTRDLFISMNKFGNIDAHLDEREINLNQFQEVKNTYNGLLDYLHTFLQVFPCPGKQTTGSQWNQYNWNQTRRNQTYHAGGYSSNSYSYNRGRGNRRASHRKFIRGFMVVVFIIFVLCILGALL